MGALLLCFLLLVAASADASKDDKYGGKKIKKVVVVMEENRSFDHLLGWSGIRGINGVSNSSEFFNFVSTFAKKHKVFASPDARMVTDCDPDHGTPGTTDKIFGQEALGRNDTRDPAMVGFVERAKALGREHTRPSYCGVMSGHPPAHVPVLKFLAEEFCVADRFFASMPGPTWPNRLFFLSGTSAGLTTTGPWYKGVTGSLYPQKTIFDQVEESGRSWKNYYVDSPWELFVEKLAQNPENLATMEEFFRDAKAGTLPHFSWINPRSGVNMSTGEGSSDMHPDHDVALAEKFYKNIYEAVRASPDWEHTLLAIVFDEHGGFWDHVPTPLNVPPPDGEPSYPLKDFKFDRLGIRLPIVFISPWIKKGTVLSDPPPSEKPAPNSEYELTSVISTTRKLLGITTGPLTKRDAWAATFTHIFDEDNPRSDCPAQTPEPHSAAHTAAEEGAKPVNGLQREIMEMHAVVRGKAIPGHVRQQKQVAEWLQREYSDHDAATRKWKSSKTDERWRVALWPAAQGGWKANAWFVNRSNDFVTFSTKDGHQDVRDFCLEWGAANPLAGQEVRISRCHAAIDRTQRWTFGGDSTIRPQLHAHAPLCITAHVVDHSKKSDLVTLEPCDAQNAQQHWAWMGPAPGNPYMGTLLFGPWSLDVVQRQK